jgi:hypothetical protein
MSGYDSEESMDFEGQVLDLDGGEGMGDAFISPVDYREEDTPTGSLLDTQTGDSRGRPETFSLCRNTISLCREIKSLAY